MVNLLLDIMTDDGKINLENPLIKQVEIGRENVNIIFRVSPYPSKNNSTNLLEDCRVSANTCIADFHL